jgi:hypothetical protein
LLQPHSLFVEGDKGLRAEPAALIGDEAIGKVAARIAQRQSGFRRWPVDDEVSLFGKRRIASAIRTDGLR